MCRNHIPTVAYTIDTLLENNAFQALLCGNCKCFVEDLNLHLKNQIYLLNLMSYIQVYVYVYSVCRYV